MESILPGLSALTTDAAWIVDPDGRITYWNKKAERLFGYTAAEVVGRLCPDILVACRKCLVSSDGKFATPHPPFSRRIRLRGKDGRNRYVKLTTVVLGEADSYQSAFALHIAHSCREPAEGLRIHLLGPVVVERADETQVAGAKWRRTKVRGLLAILALNKGLPVHRERLLEVLWSELDYAAARQNLNSTIYDLRRCLAPADGGNSPDFGVIYESNHYALKWSPVDWLDTAEFEHRINQARAASSPARAMAHYRRALSLYRDDFLSDVILVFADNFYLREQWRLRELYLEALEELGVLEECQGRIDSAHELFTRILVLDPCRERTSRRLISLYLHTGNLTMARAVFDQLATTLMSEFGTTPDPDICQLFNLEPSSQ